MKFACKNCGQHYEVDDEYITQVFPVNCKCGMIITNVNTLSIIKQEDDDGIHFYHVCWWIGYINAFTGLLISMACESGWYLLCGLGAAFILYTLGYFAKHIYLISKSLQIQKNNVE